MSATAIELAVAPAPVIDVDLVAGTATVEVAAEPVTIEVEFVGVPGQKGDPGPVAGVYDHVQAIAAAVWTISHNLGFRPTVSVYTDGGVTRLAEARNLSTNVLEIHFAQPVSGTAHLS